MRKEALLAFGTLLSGFAVWLAVVPGRCGAG